MGRYIHLPNSPLGTHQVPSALPGRGETSFLWGVWHHGGDLWHDPRLCEGVKVAQMHSSHSGVRRIAYTASPGLIGGSSFSTCPLQLVGQWVIETFWVVQSTSGLWCDSQGCPMITDCHPRLVTANCALFQMSSNVGRIMICYRAHLLSLVLRAR